MGDEERRRTRPENAHKDTAAKPIKQAMPVGPTRKPDEMFVNFGVSLENELAQSIPKSNIYCFKHLQKFMGFRLDGDQVRRGPAVVQAPVAPEVVPPPEVPQSPTHEDQPPVVNEAPIPQDVPQTPPFQTSSPLLPEVEIPSFTPHYQASASASTGGPSVPPNLYSFLNDKLENSVNAQFIKQKEAADHATQRFNKLVGTLADASLELKEHQETLEKVLQGILANSQTNLFKSQEAVSQISKTRLSFAHMVDDLEGMKNLSAHIDNEMSILKKELRDINRHGFTSSSSSSQSILADLSAFQSNMFFPGSPFVASGGGSSQECYVFVLGHRCVALWFEVCRLVGLRSGEVLPGRLLALLVEVLPKAASCCFGCCCSLSLYRDELFSTVLVGLRVPVARMVCFISRAMRALPDGCLHHVLVLECFGFVPSGAWVHCVVPWVASGAGDSTMCCAGCLSVRFVCRLTTSLSVGSIELSASGTFCAGLCLMVVLLPLWGGCFALSR
ncbi:hypothetical protein Taro_029450 [Colocasia esculenta]|uniref:Uncharacterized protein n=1 Tax=Colocasia esculenta TaxID=4460 RepID=A0A843VTA5_COLES|nr:hypothetical protein [Colocasia esculenta]